MLARSQSTSLSLTSSCSVASIRLSSKPSSSVSTGPLVPLLCQSVEPFHELSRQRTPPPPAPEVAPQPTSRRPLGAGASSTAPQQGSFVPVRLPSTFHDRTKLGVFFRPCASSSHTPRVRKLQYEGLGYDPTRCSRFSSVSSGRRDQYWLLADSVRSLCHHRVALGIRAPLVDLWTAGHPSVKTAARHCSPITACFVSRFNDSHRLD